MKQLRTKVDELCYFLEGSPNKEAKLADIVSFVGATEESLLDVIEILAQSDVCEIQSKPLEGRTVKLKRVVKGYASEEKIAGKILDEYSIETYGVKAYVEIQKGQDQPVDVYTLSFPMPGPYTQMFLSIVKDNVAKKILITSEELIDARKSAFVLARFFEVADTYLSKIPGLNKKTKEILAGLMITKMYGLGDAEFLLADPNIEDIGINGAMKPISVYHKKYGWLKTNLMILTEEDIYNLAAQIGRKSGRDITMMTPLLDTHLVSGDRASASLFPISTAGNTITIRKFARNPWTIVDFINPSMHTLSLDMAAFLWMCMHYEMNIMVGGGTASGKTSLLNTLCALIPPKERNVSIEDTREIKLPDYLSWNWIPLTTREPNAEGKGGVPMLKLIQSSLRMRPDRIIIGEIRDKAEAEVAFEAMHTGHAVYSTIHSDTSNQIIRRLMHEPFNIPSMELSTLQVVVIQYRDRRTGVRRTYEITEVSQGAGDTVSLNKLYLWHPRKDTFEKASKSLRVFEELNLHTGMTPNELDKDLGQKADILKWMLNNGVSNVNDVGMLSSIYYRDPDYMLKAVSKKWNVNKVMEKW